MSYANPCSARKLGEHKTDIEHAFFAYETLDRISQRMQCSRSTLVRFIRYCGLAREAVNKGGGQVKWKPEHVAKLRTLWAEGKSATEISQEVPFGRNAVIGKVHRLKLTDHGQKVSRPRRTKPSSDLVRAARKRPLLAKPTPLVPLVPPPPSIPEPYPRCLSLFELTKRTCKWPLGDGPFVFCGHATHDGPYCRFHRVRAYRAPLWQYAA